jgi:hypothetical protein
VKFPFAPVHARHGPVCLTSGIALGPVSLNHTFRKIDG